MILSNLKIGIKNGNLKKRLFLAKQLSVKVQGDPKGHPVLTHKRLEMIPARRVDRMMVPFSSSSRVRGLRCHTGPTAQWRSPVLPILLMEMETERQEAGRLGVCHTLRGTQG